MDSEAKISIGVQIQFIEPDTTVLVINDAILKDEGLYSVSARNVAGAVSSSAMLHVEETEHDYSIRYINFRLFKKCILVGLYFVLTMS